MIAVGKAMTTMVKPNLHDLFDLHSSRGTKVRSKKDADIIFSLEKEEEYADKTVTPHDVDTIIGEYL